MSGIQLVSVQVGLPRTIEPGPGGAERPWVSAIFKGPVAGPVRVTGEGLEGDAVANTKHHGGPDQAVLAYSADCYPAWRDELELPDLPFGAFGENLSLAGACEDTVCVGDTYTVGGVTLQVTQPRGPCSKLDWRIGKPGVEKRSVATGRTGWYLRVLEAGDLEAGQPVELVARPHPGWTITRAHTAMRGRRQDPESVRELLALPEVGARWRAALKDAS